MCPKCRKQIPHPDANYCPYCCTEIRDLKTVCECGHGIHLDVFCETPTHCAWCGKVMNLEKVMA